MLPLSQLLMSIKKLQRKRAGYRTLEAVIAITTIFGFLILFLQQQRSLTAEDVPAEVLAPLLYDEQFRNCAIQKNSSCINTTINDNLEDKYDFLFNLSTNPNAVVSGLPQQKRVFANSLYVAGNLTNSSATIVRLFFWTK